MNFFIPSIVTVLEKISTVDGEDLEDVQIDGYGLISDHVRQAKTYWVNFDFIPADALSPDLI